MFSFISNPVPLKRAIYVPNRNNPIAYLKAKKKGRARQESTDGFQGIKLTSHFKAVKPLFPGKKASLVLRLKGTLL
jgi:hypothetical protein